MSAHPATDENIVYPIASDFFRFEQLRSPLSKREAYALRYDVYCLERGFLDPAAYPDGLETDEYDPQSILFGARDRHDEIIGTIRLVLDTPLPLPVFAKCVITDQAAVDALRGKGAEISRLAIARHYRRRRHDGAYGMNVGPGTAPGTERRSNRPEIVLGLIQAMYMCSLAENITYWFAAMERPLIRMLARLGFIFRRIGPETDYYGPVAPYVMTMEEFNENLGRVNPELLASMTPKDGADSVSHP